MRFFAVASLALAAASSVFAGPVVERENTGDLVVVLTNLQNAIARPVANLHSLAANNDVSKATVQPHIEEIKVAFNIAIGAAQQAGSSPLGDVLGLVTGIISTVLNLVAGLLVVADGVVQMLLAVVVGLVGSLLQVLVPLVDGLVGAVVGLVLSLLAPLTKLGVNGAFSVVTGN